jgi:M6 family metalloprotease-like protein
MSHSWWRALLGTAWALCGGSLLADEPPKKPDLSGYRTVQDATTRAIAPVRAGHPGETGYLGVSLLRDGQWRLVVQEVQPESPAAKAGVLKGDLLTQLDGKPVKSPETFRDSLQMRGPGALVKLALVRGEQHVESSATLSSTSRPRTVNAQRAYIGLVLGELKEGQGVRIDQVAPGSPAASAGFKPGDQLFQIEGVDFTNASRLAEILVEKRPGDDFEVTVRRAGADISLRPRLAADPGGVAGAGGGPARAGRGGGQGQGPINIPLWTNPVFRVAVIGIEYPDVKHNPKISLADWHKAMLGEGTYQDQKSANDGGVDGSLNDYFAEQSAAGFQLQGKVFHWIEVGKKRSEYVLGSGTTNITAVLVEALDKIVARDGKDAFKDFDGFLFLYAGDQVQGNRGGVYYPHAGMLRSFQSKRWPYLIAPEGGTRPTPTGGFVKEFGQMLGLPDLAARTENRGSEGLGAWCAMSNPSKTNRPQHLGAWSKEKLGWIKPTVIDPTIPQKLILAPIESSSHECFKVLVRADGSEYYLLENRRKVGYDRALPGEGLLIWRVVRDRPILEESHGIEGPTGPTVQLDTIPYPSSANHAFTPETTPSSRSPLGGGLPVSITNIRRLPDGRITFHIGYEYN